MKKLSLAMVGMVLLSGCSLSPDQDPNTTTTPVSSTSQADSATRPEIKAYSGTDFSFNYPANYTVDAGDFGVTVRGPEGSIIISTVALDIAPANTVEAPKDVVSHGYNGKISSGMFYEGETAPTSLLIIRDSITVTK